MPVLEINHSNLLLEGRHRVSSDAEVRELVESHQKLFTFLLSPSRDFAVYRLRKFSKTAGCHILS